MNLTGKQKAAFGIGAIGKDMVYALSASYVMYYYQDIIGLSPTFVGLILMVARVFDAFNDPFMGILVAKTRTRWGRFRPYLVSGTVLNAFVLYALFAAPSRSGSTAVMVYFSVVYILWGMTYTMMDIPYWSMIPAITDTPADTENLSVIGRTCAGVGSAIIAMLTVLSVKMLGAGSERAGFRRFALIVAVIFIVTEIICAVSVREKDTEMKTATIKEMFHALLTNDQAIVVVIAIVLVNSALYLTSNLIIYFFKYDVGGANWQGTYTLFSTVGGAFQILGMMIGYPLLRKKHTNVAIFKGALFAAVIGYLLILLLCLTGLSTNIALLFIPGAIVFACNGILTVLTTVFLSNSVDYGEIKTGHREESVIFSMQTFVVKLASGVSVFITGIGLDLIGLVGNSDAESVVVQQSASTLVGLRLLMTIMPTVVLVAAVLFFGRKFKLTDEIVMENAKKLKEKNRAAAENA